MHLAACFIRLARVRLSPHSVSTWRMWRHRVGIGVEASDMLPCGRYFSIHAFHSRKSGAWPIADRWILEVGRGDDALAVVEARGLQGRATEAATLAR